MHKQDIAIIGGGPAGLSAAIEFAQGGFLVTLIEPKAAGIDKPCGEGIMPEGVAHLVRLGVFKHLDVDNMSPFFGIAFNNGAKRRALSTFSQGYGLGCRRTNLSQAFYKRVQELSNISLIQAEAKGILETSQAMVVLSDKGSISARLIIGADGLRSSTRRWAALGAMPAVSQRYGMRQHFRVEPWSDKVEVFFRPGIEAYVTPCGPKQTNIAFLWAKGAPHTQKPAFNKFLELFPVLKKRLLHAEPCSKDLAIGPLEQRCHAPIAQGLALVGDASGYLDAITGEGNSVAFAQVQALYKTTEQELRKKASGPLNVSVLNAYMSAHRAIVSVYYRNTKLLLWCARRPTLMAGLITMGDLFPRVFSRSIEMFRRGLSKAPNFEFGTFKNHHQIQRLG